MHVLLVNKDSSHIKKSDIPLLSTFLDLTKPFQGQNRSDLMPPSIFQTPNFSNQFPFPLEVRKIGIPLYVIPPLPIPNYLCWLSSHISLVFFLATCRNNWIYF